MKPLKAIASGDAATAHAVNTQLGDKYNRRQGHQFAVRFGLIPGISMNRDRKGACCDDSRGHTPFCSPQHPRRERR